MNEWMEERVDRWTDGRRKLLWACSTRYTGGGKIGIEEWKGPQLGVKDLASRAGPAFSLLCSFIEVPHLKLQFSHLKLNGEGRVFPWKPPNGCSRTLSWPWPSTAISHLCNYPPARLLLQRLRWGRGSLNKGKKEIAGLPK